MTTGLTLQEASARESPEVQEKIRQEARRLRAEYAIAQIRKDREISQAKLAGPLGRLSVHCSQSSTRRRGS